MTPPNGNNRISDEIRYAIGEAIQSEHDRWRHALDVEINDRLLLQAQMHRECVSKEMMKVIMETIDEKFENINERYDPTRLWVYGIIAAIGSGFLGAVWALLHK